MKIIIYVIIYFQLQSSDMKILPIPSEEFWTPAIQISNTAGDYSMKNIEYHLRWSNKKVQFKYLGYVTFRCPMNFEKYPFDENNCQFVMHLQKKYTESNKMKLIDVLNGSIFDADTSISIAEYDVKTRHKQVPNKLVIDISLQRTTDMVNLFLPSTLPVIMSWIRYVLVQKPGKN